MGDEIICRWRHNPAGGENFNLTTMGEKLSIRATLITILRYLEAKFDYGYFIIFFALWFQDSTQVISTKNEGVTVIFPNFDFILNQKNQHHAFFFARNDLKFFVLNLRTTMQKKL